MGMRRNIAVQYDNGSKIYFYTHWLAGSLPKILAEALEFGRGRWDDESYLARIIFSHMIKDDVLDETGFGIAPYVMDDEYPTIEVDMNKQLVNNVPYEDFLKNPQMFNI